MRVRQCCVWQMLVTRAPPSDLVCFDTRVTRVLLQHYYCNGESVNIFHACFAPQNAQKIPFQRPPRHAPRGSCLLLPTTTRFPLVANLLLPVQSTVLLLFPPSSSDFSQSSVPCHFYTDFSFSRFSFPLPPPFPPTVDGDRSESTRPAIHEINLPTVTRALRQATTTRCHAEPVNFPSAGSP